MKQQSRKRVFQMTTKVQKMENSLGIGVPQQVVEKLDVSNRSMIELTASK